MTTHRPLRTIAALTFLLAACAGSSGFQQSTVRDTEAERRPTVNDKRVEQAFALRPQLPKPYRLGVYFRDAESTGAEAAWRWEPKHRDAILALEKHLVGKGEVSDVFSVGHGAVAGDSLPDIRVAAARHGADAVLIVSGIDEAERSANGWAATYAAVLPLFFAPGNDLDVVFTTHAEMWDVRNEYLYLAAEAEAESHQRRALPYIDVEEAIEESQAEAVTLLATELQGRFDRLHAVTQ